MSSENFAWLVEHSLEVQEKYAGKWIAVHKDGVIGVGDTAKEAADQARENAPGEAFVLEAVDKETDVIYGGS